MSFTRFWAMCRKEAIQLRRDPRSLMLAFLLPVTMIVLFGYAITFDVKNIRLGVYDLSRTRESRDLIDRFVSSGYFQIVEYLERYRYVEDRLDAGTVDLVLVLPFSFKPDLATEGGAKVQILLDGADANTATIAQNYASAIVSRYRLDSAGKGRGLSLPIEMASRVWYNETLESRNMIVPGLVAVIMSIIAAMLTALTIAREWERGTMEQLAATPVHRWEVVLGKLTPYVVVGLIDVAIAAAAGLFIFQVPFRGSVLLLFLMTFLFLLGALSLGLFISASVKSQILATQVAMLATYLPALLLSGFMFSIDTMPIALRAITTVVPARYYVTVTRGIFLKGVGIDVLWVEALAMVLFATIGLSLAIRAFKKELT